MAVATAQPAVAVAAQPQGYAQPVAQPGYGAPVAQAQPMGGAPMAVGQAMPMQQMPMQEMQMQNGHGERCPSQQKKRATLSGYTPLAFLFLGC